MDRNFIIDTLNHAMHFIPEENEIADNLEDVIRHLEDEWAEEFRDDLEE